MTTMLASLCAVCGGWGRARVCDGCRALHAPARARCPRCALPVAGAGLLCIECRRNPPPQAATVAALDYGFPWDRLLGAFKYHGAIDLAVPLAGLLADAVRSAQLARAACVLPVPLGPGRLRERGYNQAWEVARRVARTLGLPARADGLQRWLDGEHQVGHTRTERIAALRGAFGVDSAQAGRWRGGTVALVDDVMTSGATAAEAARVLLAAGAATVQVWVVARTP
jgi:ComF family protein